MRYQVLSYSKNVMTAGCVSDMRRLLTIVMELRGCTLASWQADSYRFSTCDGPIGSCAMGGHSIFEPMCDTRYGPSRLSKANAGCGFRSQDTSTCSSRSRYGATGCVFASSNRLIIAGTHPKCASMRGGYAGGGPREGPGCGIIHEGAE